MFFQFSAEEARIIEERRRPELKLGLALQIGFLRMSGRLLDAVRMVPPVLWRHLGARFGVAAPDLASLRAMPAELILNDVPSPIDPRVHPHMIIDGRIVPKSFGDAYFSTTWTDVVLFGILILVLVFRPTGLLGTRVPEK